MIDAALRASLAAFDDAALADPGESRPGATRPIVTSREGKLRLVSARDGKVAVEGRPAQLVTLDTRRASLCGLRLQVGLRSAVTGSRPVLFLQAVGEGRRQPMRHRTPAVAADPGDNRHGD